VGVASQLSLDIPTFKECLIDPRTAAVVEESYDTARQLGIDSTPSVFLNGELIGGVLPDEQLADKILSILKDQGVPGRAPDEAVNPRAEAKLR
jgi:protein-disulfide isomerase